MSDVVEMLREAGVAEVRQPEGKSNFWVAGFTVDGAETAAVLLLPEHGEYFIALTPIVSNRLDAKLESLPRAVLSALIREASGVPYAKIEYLENDGTPGFVATSECSTDQVSGLKLRRRLEACATLATRIVRTLEALPPAST